MTWAEEQVLKVLQDEGPCSFGQLARVIIPLRGDEPPSTDNRVDIAVKRLSLQGKILRTSTQRYVLADPCNRNICPTCRGKGWV